MNYIYRPDYVYELIRTVHEDAGSSGGKDSDPHSHGPSADESISPQGPGGQLPDSEVHPAQLSICEAA